MLYVYTLIAMGIIWVLITRSFRHRIKKYWLYTLFPTLIYSAGLFKYVEPPYIYFSATIVSAITIYFALKVWRGFSYKDTLITPLTLISTIIAMEIMAR